MAGRLLDHTSEDSRNLRILTWARLEIEDQLRELIAASRVDPLRRVRELADAGRVDSRWAPEDVSVVLISSCEAWHVAAAPAGAAAADAARRRELVLHLAKQLLPHAPA